MINDFCIHDLTAQYDRVTSHFQLILKAIVLREEKDLKRNQRDSDAVSDVLKTTMSILLILFSMVGH